jgi:hypothetical protein
MTAEVARARSSRRTPSESDRHPLASTRLVRRAARSTEH